MAQWGHCLQEIQPIGCQGWTKYLGEEAGEEQAANGVIAYKKYNQENARAGQNNWGRGG